MHAHGSDDTRAARPSSAAVNPVATGNIGASSAEIRAATGGIGAASAENRAANRNNGETSAENPAATRKTPAHTPDPSTRTSFTTTKQHECCRSCIFAEPLHKKDASEDM